MAETVLAGEKVKELTSEERLRSAANILAVFSGFTENLLVRDCPRNTGDRKCNDEEVNNLGKERHHIFGFGLSQS